jgi:hypothetical protein
MRNCLSCELSNVKDEKLWCRHKKEYVKNEDCCNGYQRQIKEYK